MVFSAETQLQFSTKTGTKLNDFLQVNALIIIYLPPPQFLLIEYIFSSQKIKEILILPISY